MFRMLNLRSLAQSKNRLLAHKSGIVRVDATSSVVYCPFRKVSHLCNRERVHSLLIARGTYRARKGRESEEMCRWGPVLVSVSRRIYLPKVQRIITSSPGKHVLARYCVFILRRAKACNLTDAHSPFPPTPPRFGAFQPSEFVMVNKVTSNRHFFGLILLSDSTAVNTKRVHSTTPSAEIVSTLGGKKAKRRRSNDNKFTELLAGKHRVHQPDSVF